VVGHDVTDIAMATEQIEHLLAAIDATAAMALREAGAVALRFLMKPCGEAPASVDRRVRAIIAPCHPRAASRRAGPSKIVTMPASS
jgi:hypothetical protein